MKQRNQRGALRIVLLASLFTILVSTVAHDKPYNPADRAVHESYRANTENIEEASDGLQERSSDDTEHCNDTSARNGPDICAQWSAAHAAQESAQASWQTLYVSAAGLALLLLTLIPTAGAALAAERAARGLVNSERPHVRLFVTAKTKKKDGTIIATNGVTFRNYGRTPALVKKLSISYTLADSPPDPKNCPFERRYPDDSIIPQDEPWPFKGWIPQFEGRSLGDLIGEHRATGQRLFVYGKITYKDAFGKERVTAFCREFNGRNFTYNRTDVNDQKNLNYAT
ncbi:MULTISPECIES: hypothetical protein [unclassified Mesorhizobium]|uniref:hypothetical protein n=1 Tax=unclassified Mesorhizobium TaxID=325217 RepID=UPI000FD4C722|nr:MULTISPECIES: hypothetical protein [unclassified Mesorhizobium]RVB75883.1 hypothetical protein EN885_18685 [Mesorhizobium sp. M6A.T.Cr.TU.014.01.1.1]RWP79458.1 MAG: hypothetical protein EOR10_11795 [Mesorhizobium sp.]RWQ03353.1 MAG: hypothetical protein EOR91_18805 [Mesorhizobium sp.]RWQ04335.1 MAG: hypothetical protein EOR90_17005 [Mesorhizobium sp.]